MQRLGTDFIIACTILVASSFASFISYQKIVEIESPRNLFFQEFLILGEKNYAILNNKICIGQFKINFNQDNSAYLESSGFLNLHYQANNIQSKFEANLYFNPLGQLVESNINIKAPNNENTAEVKIKSEDANPIRVNLTSIINQKENNFSKTFPGPLSIVNLKNNRFGFEYSPSQKNDLTYIKPQLDFFANDFKIEIVAMQDGTDCSSQLNLEPFFNKLVNELKFLKNLSFM